MVDTVQAELKFNNRSVSSIAELKATLLSQGAETRRSGSIIVLEGSPNGLYRYETASTATPDDLEVVVPNGIIPPAPGRWLRVAALNKDGTAKWVDAGKTPAGLEDSDDLILSVNDGTRTFTATLDTSETSYYSRGDKYTIDTNQNAVFADQEGLFYFYFGLSGNLFASPVSDFGSLMSNRQTSACLALGYWDETNDEMIFLGDEKYEIPLDNYLRGASASVEGLRLLNGGLLEDFDVDQDGSDDAHAQFGIENTQTVLASRRYTDSVSSTTGLPIFYFDGANAYLRRNVNAGFSVSTTGTGRIAYNQFTGGNWQLTEVTDGYYVNYFTIQTNDINTGAFSLMGSAEYTTKGAAINGASGELEGILSRMPGITYTLLGQELFQTDDTYTNSVKGRAVSISGQDYRDLRPELLNNINKIFKHTDGLSQKNKYFVAEAGSDNNNGLSGGTPFATPQKAFDTIAVLSGAAASSQTNQYDVDISDGATYTGPFDMSSVEWVTVTGDAAHIRSDTIKFNDNCTINLQELSRPSGGAPIWEKVGSGTAYLNVTKNNGEASQSVGYVDEGTINVTGDEFLAINAAGVCISTNPANTCECRISAKSIRGRMIANANAKIYFDTDFYDGDPYALSAIPMYAHAKEWTGNIGNIIAAGSLYLRVDKRNSSDSGDFYESEARVYRNGETFRKHDIATNYNPARLTDHSILAFTNTASPRSGIISTEDVSDASPTAPRYFTAKDASGGAGTNNITISLESGTIDGAANFVINSNNNSITFYVDGTNGFII